MVGSTVGLIGSYSGGRGRTEFDVSICIVVGECEGEGAVWLYSGMAVSCLIVWV